MSPAGRHLDLPRDGAASVEQVQATTTIGVALGLTAVATWPVGRRGTTRN